MSSGETEGKCKHKQSSANAIASAVVSITHRDAQIKGRLNHRLPDKIIGKVFRMRSTASPEGSERKNLQNLDTTQVKGGLSGIIIIIIMILPHVNRFGY
jgi:hypothetical protein